jgi:hypothetical protein
MDKYKHRLKYTKTTSSKVRASMDQYTSIGEIYNGDIQQRKGLLWISQYNQWLNIHVQRRHPAKEGSLLDQSVPSIG